LFILSAIEAIAPAIERTRNLLFRPFQLGTFLKLCAIALFTEGFSGKFNFSSHHGAEHSSAAPFPFHFNPAIVTALAFLGIAVLVLAIVLMYLEVRLRFALFDCLVHQTRLIGPGWSKYRFQALRFFLLSMAVGVAFLLALFLILTPFALRLLDLYRQSKTSGHFPVAATIGLVLPLIPIFLLAVLAALAVSLVLRDFILPHMALENASAGQAWAAARFYIARESGPFLLYALLRILLPLAAIIVMSVALAIPGLVVFGTLGVMLAAVHSAASGAPAGTALFATLIEVMLGALVAGLALLAAITLGGPLSIAIRNYALVFYGSRYEALGRILFPPVTPAGGARPA
jgi:hypothetical protein